MKQNRREFLLTLAFSACQKRPDPKSNPQYPPPLIQS